MTIRIIPSKNQHVQVFNFPDGQPHVRYTGPAFVSVDVVHPIRNPEDLVILMLTVQALKIASCHLATLCIPYFMGARSDRINIPGDSVCNDMMNNLIDTFGFHRVAVLDIHNPNNLRINNSYNVSSLPKLLREAVPPEVIICPDYGAKARAFEANEIFPKAKLVYSDKKRDPASGKITLTVTDPEQCKDKVCLIADDLCDGGGTFLAIANQIQPKYLTLVVTHGIFSKGVDILAEKFHKIITTDSFCDEPPHKQLTVIPYNSIME